jgi:hypothetical protein
MMETHHRPFFFSPFTIDAENHHLGTNGNVIYFCKTF